MKNHWVKYSRQCERRTVAELAQRSGISVARLTAMERGYLAKNPFVSAKPIGKPRRGKPQPRIAQARKLYSELFRLAWAGESMAGCLLVQILLGPRSSEAQHPSHLLARAARSSRNPSRAVRRHVARRRRRARSRQR